jgi:hypothetical protein
VLCAVNSIQPTPSAGEPTFVRAYLATYFTVNQYLVDTITVHPDVVASEDGDTGCLGHLVNTYLETKD